jgi:hypothetical protein
MSAQPMIHWVTAAAVPAQLKPGMHIGGSGGPQVVGATILAAGISSRRSRGDSLPRPLMVAVADRVPAAGAEHAFSIREA